MRGSAEHHPSNRLYRNEVGDFREAMEVYVGQHYYENCNEIEIAEARRNAATALKAYEDAIAEAARQLRAAALPEFADALETGDYSGLAI